MNFNENLETEILASLITYDNYRPDIISIITESEAFTNFLNRKIFEVIKKMFDNGETIDVVTLASNPLLTSDIVYLSTIRSNIGTGENSVTHAQILMEQLLKRNLQTYATTLHERCESSKDVGDLMGWALKELNTTCGVITSRVAPQKIDVVIEKTFKELENRAIGYNKGETTGITTGFADLDRKSNGWQGGQIIILAGRPAMGKTAVALHFAKSAAEQNKSVVMFSLEMKATQLGDRLLLGCSCVNGEDYKKGNISSEDWQRLGRANNTLSRLPLSIADTFNASIENIRLQCLQLKAKGCCDMVIIDYLQLLSTPKHNGAKTREREVAEISRQAKIIAGELGIPVMLLSQLSRDCEKRNDKAPMLSDLRDSGAIEQDADMVIFVHRPAYYGVPTIETTRYGLIDSKGVGVLQLEKHRNGQTGKVYFSHSDDLNRMSDFTNEGCS